MLGVLAAKLWSWQVLKFSPDGRVIASGEKDQTIKLWDAANSKLLRVLPKHQGPIAALAFSPDGKTLVSASHRGLKKRGGSQCQLRFWNVKTGTETRGMLPAKDWIESLLVTPNGLLLGTGYDTVYLWDIKIGRLLRKLKGQRPLSIDKAGNFLLCGTGGALDRTKNALIWNISGIR